MKDLEKAKELSQHYSGESDYKETVGYDCAIAMAEWKKQQMIDKACEWMEKNISEYEDIYYDIGGYAFPEFYIENFIKDFKKAME